MAAITTNPLDFDLGRIGGISTLDSFGTQRALSQAVRELDEAAVERQARKEVLAEAFLDAASEGDVRVPCFFVRARVGAAHRAPMFADVLFGAVDDKKLIAQLAQLVVDAALGMPVQEKAAALLKAAAENFAEGEL